jgi:hypothetical protein
VVSGPHYFLPVTHLHPLLATDMWQKPWVMPLVAQCRVTGNQEEQGDPQHPRSPSRGLPTYLVTQELCLAPRDVLQTPLPPRLLNFFLAKNWHAVYFWDLAC